jgi:predicted metal-dependent phosphoesterase TrpH
MNIDFHFHTCISKGIGFNHNHMLASIDAAHSHGIDAFMMTDHFDNHDFRMIYQELSLNYLCINDTYYDINGIWLFPGMEVETREGCHILLNGTVPDVLRAYDLLAPYTFEATYLPLADIFTLIADIDLLKIYAHPFRPKREISRIDATFIPYFDALDINGKDLWRMGIDHQHQVRQFATAMNIPAVGGSDAHHHLQVGVIYNKLDYTCSGITTIRQAIQRGHYTTQINPHLAHMVETAQVAKKTLKNKYRTNDVDLDDTDM